MLLRTVSNKQSCNYRVRKGRRRVRATLALIQQRASLVHILAYWKMDFFELNYSCVQIILEHKQITRVPVVILSSHCKNFVLNLTKIW